MMKKKLMTHEQACKKAFNVFPEGYVDVYFKRHRWCECEIEDECGVYYSLFEKHFQGPTYEDVFAQIKEYMLSKEEVDQKHQTDLMPCERISYVS